jgi:hypothetical protein
MSPISDPGVSTEWKIRGGATSTHPDRFELWSMRLERVRMRAIWSPDFALDENKKFWPKGYLHDSEHPFRGPLDSRDRHESWL